jgi:hypothetical protein
MESGYYTFANEFASDNQVDIESTVKKVAVTASAAMDLNAVEEGIRGFVEGTQILMKALDAVAQVHPFIGGRINYHFTSNVKLINVHSRRARV